MVCLAATPFFSAATAEFKLTYSLTKMYLFKLAETALQTRLLPAHSFHSTVRNGKLRFRTVLCRDFLHHASSKISMDGRIGGGAEVYLPPLYEAVVVYDH